MSDARLARWLAPIAASAAEPRFHPTYETVRNETAKLDSPAAGAPDWSAILPAGDTFLGEVGKDLVVATSVALALGHREGASGLTLGLELVAALVRMSDAAPMRPRARANAIAFLVARGETVLDAKPPREASVIDPLVVALGTLGAALSETLGDDAPSLRPLTERASRARTSLPAAALPPPEPPPEPKPIFAPPPPPPPPPPSAPPAEASAPRESVPTQLRKHAAALLETASAMRATSPLDADALRVSLAALYLPISALPPTSRGARTALAPPPKLVIESIERLSTDGAPDALVREILAALEKHRLALDLHLHLSRALERAGEAAAPAKRAHRHELSGLHARLPGLAALEFSDGTPLASPATRELLDALVRPPSTKSGDASEPSPLDAARELARDGRLAEALSHASRARSEAASGRARFETTLGLAAIAEEARALPLAEELHAALLREIDERQLDAWEPGLAATALVAHLRLARATPGREPLAKTLFGRLAVVDPSAALPFATPHATAPKTAR